MSGIYTVYADGSIGRDGQFVRAAIRNGTSTLQGRILDRGFRGTIETSLAAPVDVTEAWGSNDLPAIVGAILDGDAMPAGWVMGERKGGVAMVKRQGR